MDMAAPDPLQVKAVDILKGHGREREALPQA
jgi:hypothetical protein